MFLSGGGLGEPAHRVLRHLDCSEGRTVRELATATSLKPSQLRGPLNRLRELGVCRRDDDGFWTLLPFSPDDIAEAIGTKGKAARRRRTREWEIDRRRAEVDKWRENRLRDRIRRGDLQVTVKKNKRKDQ